MTWEEAKHRIDNHVQEDFSHLLWLLPITGKKRLMAKSSLIYLCKLCYESGYEYGIQTERERDRKGQIILGKASSSRRI